MIDPWEIISCLPINSNQKLKIFCFIKKLAWYVKYNKAKYSFFKENQVFANSNHYYGHEYWLKKYSGYTGMIYGIIEHGVYFGDNRTYVCPKEEWDLGSVLTFGDSRINLLHEIHPELNVVGIGPRIHYAETDIDYLNELKSLVNLSGKVMTLFPAHSLAAEKSNYNSTLFLSQAENIADRIGAKTILVSLHPSDYLHQLNLTFNNKKVIFVGGGNNPIKFLPRLRAIFEISDLTFSNSIGTHVGYSVYMNVPHIMDLSSNRNKCENPVKESEQNEFSRLFDSQNILNITEEQKRLCDKYFGYKYIKSPKELYEILYQCSRKYQSIYYD